MQRLFFAGYDQWNRKRKYHHQHQTGLLSSRLQFSLFETAVSKPGSVQRFIWIVKQLIIQSTCFPWLPAHQRPVRNIHFPGQDPTRAKYLSCRGTRSALARRQVDTETTLEEWVQLSARFCTWRLGSQVDIRGCNISSVRTIIYQCLSIYTQEHKRWPHFNMCALTVNSANTHWADFPQADYGQRPLSLQ